MKRVTDKKGVVNMKNPLIELYGEEALEESFIEIQKLKGNSNIVFDGELVRIGISFMQMKAKETLNGEKSKVKLSSLVSESFGEAAIYKYNC